MGLMVNQIWKKALKKCADPQRARHFLEKLRAAGLTPAWDGVSPGQAAVLAALFSGSQVLGELLITHPDWWSAPAFDPEVLQQPRQKQGLQREVGSWLKPLLSAREYKAALAQLRQFKQREMLRIAARDLARLGGVPEVIGEISNVADVCLEAVYQVVRQQLADRFGRAYHRDAEGSWRTTGLVVIGLGKLGGQELNYSSDVDVLFVYEEEGSVFGSPPSQSQVPGQAMSNHAFFTRLVENFVAEVTRLTPEGSLFRIDLRLRPEGNAGPLVRSLAGFENYYAQWGQPWERMMLIKARAVAGDTALASEFLEMIQSFRYPRTLGERILKEVAGMKTRIENEVLKGDEVERNVKLGRGGIREIEFVVQILQLLHAGHQPFLQGASTLQVLDKLVQYNRLAASDAQDLNQAYCFLRQVEHRLQMESNLQTHTIPADRQSLARLAALMGFNSPEPFTIALRKHTGQVRQTYDQLLKIKVEESKLNLPAQFEGQVQEWKRLLQRHAFRDPDQALRLLKLFVHGPGYVHVSNRSVELARELIVRILALCPQQTLTDQQSGVDSLPTLNAINEVNLTTASATAKCLSDPDRVLARLDSFIAAYGARATLYEMWASHPSLFTLLIWLFDRSEFLAEIAIRVPDLVDELEISGRLLRAKTAAEILKDLRHGRADADQKLWLRRYHQAEFMRIGLRDILELADEEQNLVELSALAEACLQYALEAAQRECRIKAAPLVVIGLGKLGGEELTYGSDLDLLFVADARTKNLARLQGLAVKVMDLLSSQTEMGVAFATDARLRPDGAKGLLVNILPAYEDYYRHRASLWEIQALTRARPIAGNFELGRSFRKMAAELTDFSHPSTPLAAYTPNWKQGIAKMRQRIENERVPAGQQTLAFKTGQGGLMDAEFIAQMLCLAQGWQEPNTLKALEKALEAGVLPDASLLIDNFRKLRRIECILRRWSYMGETELPHDPAPLYRVAVRCGFPHAEALLQAVSQYRAAIRAVYQQVMS